RGARHRHPAAGAPAAAGRGEPVAPGRPHGHAAGAHGAARDHRPGLLAQVLPAGRRRHGRLSPHGADQRVGHRRRAGHPGGGRRLPARPARAPVPLQPARDRAQRGLHRARRPGLAVARLDGGRGVSDGSVALERLLAIMARLRDPDGGCPWDLAQDFTTIAPYTIEEAYEVADAIDRGDMAALRDELGDLLLQVVFHAQMAREAGHFAFADVANAIADKMERRHPHVFGDARAADADAVRADWEAIKRAERAAAGEADASALAGVARGLPEWQRAVKLQDRAARVGFDWPGPGPVLAKLAEELEEVRAEFAAVAADGGDAAARERLEGELGDLLFVAAN